MEDELYTRQQSLGLSVPNTVAVVGCGGIGSWVAIFSAMSGVPNLYLFDPDNMEESNRNRLPFCQGSLNRKKVEVVSEYIRAIRPDCNVAAVPEKLEPGVLLNVLFSTANVLVECTDSPRSQIRLYKECKGKIPFIRAGYDGTKITVTSHVSGWIKDTETEAYTFNPSWVVPAATVAALAVAKMMKFPNHETNLDLTEIGVPVLERQKRLTKRCA